MERLLYRLSQSEHSDQFLLKGALLFALWYDMPHRPTRDADLLGFGASDLESIVKTFRDIAGVQVEDGIIFDPASVDAEEIRKDAGYAGARVLISAELANARCKTQIDIGFGDAVTPGPVAAEYPTLIDDLPAPKLRTYPVYTVVSEKLHAIVLLGMTNSRVKDYLDLSVLLDRESLNLKYTCPSYLRDLYAARHGCTDRIANRPYRRIRGRPVAAGTVDSVPEEKRPRIAPANRRCCPTTLGFGTNDRHCGAHTHSQGTLNASSNNRHKRRWHNADENHSRNRCGPWMYYGDLSY